MGRVYAVASAKGGVGKTTTTANLGATLAAAGYDVVVVDADLGMANLAGALGVVGGGATVHDVLAGEATVEQATYEGPHGLRVLPGSTELGSYAGADPAGLGDVVDALSGYDYLFVDTGAGLSHDSVLPLGAADEILLVSTASRDAVGDTAKTVEVADRLGSTVVGLVVTRLIEGQDAEAAAEQVGADLLVTVPEDVSVRHATDRGVPLTVDAPDSPAAAAYRTLGGVLTGEEIDGPTSAAEPGDVEGEPEADDTDADVERGSPPEPRSLVETTTAALTLRQDDGAGDQGERTPEQTPPPRVLTGETTAALSRRADDDVDRYVGTPPNDGVEGGDPSRAPAPDPRTVDDETTAALTRREETAEETAETTSTPGPRTVDDGTTAALTRREATDDETASAPSPRPVDEATTSALTPTAAREPDEGAADGSGGDGDDGVEISESVGGVEGVAIGSPAGDEAEETDEETAVPDAEAVAAGGEGTSGEGVTFPETDSLESEALDMDDDEGVFDTSFIEQAEELERDVSEREKAKVEGGEGNDGSGGGRKGFFERLFGGD